jgi:hypothetical protein
MGQTSLKRAKALRQNIFAFVIFHGHHHCQRRRSRHRLDSWRNRAVGKKGEEAEEKAIVMRNDGIFPAASAATLRFGAEWWAEKREREREKLKDQMEGESESREIRGERERGKKCPCVSFFSSVGKKEIL